MKHSAADGIFRASLRAGRKARRPTLADIEAHKTPRGGYTKATLAGWGVPWPPPKGWKEALASGKFPL